MRKITRLIETENDNENAIDLFTAVGVSEYISTKIEGIMKETVLEIADLELIIEEDVYWY